MLKKILFPTDFSETAMNAFRYTLKLADHFDSEIILLHVVYPEYEVMEVPVMSAQVTNQKIETVKPMLEMFMENGISRVVAEQTFDRMPNIVSKHEIGTPVEVIRYVAAKEDVDLVVMGTRGKHTNLDKIFGSVASGVIHRANCPVLVIPECATFKFPKSITYATTYAAADPLHIRDAIEILNLRKPKVNCVHVKAKDEIKTDIDVEAFEDYLEDQELVPDVEVYEIEEDTVAEGLEEFVEAYRTDLLVMHKQKANFIQRLFHRSQTKAMALRTHIPLLIVR